MEVDARGEVGADQGAGETLRLALVVERGAHQPGVAGVVGVRVGNEGHVGGERGALTRTLMPSTPVENASMELLWIVLGLLGAWAIGLYWLAASGRLAKWNLSLMLGVVLMVRTQRGTKLIETLSKPKRFWNAVADVGLVVTLLGMVAMTVLFVWSALFALQPDSGLQPLGLSEILVIPGVNPFVPLWYGLVALIVTLVVHEGGHGILARANGMRLKSLGLLVAVVPIGAFVEPDEEDLKAGSRRKRLRVFAAGPAINVAVAALCLAGFAAMAGAAAVAPGVHVAGVVAGAPAADAGLAGGMSLLAVDNTTLAGWPDLRGYLDTTSPGQTIRLTADDGTVHAVALESRWDNTPSAVQDAILAGTPEAIATCEAVLRHEVTSGPACAEELQRLSFMGFNPLLPEELGFLRDPFAHGGLGFLSLVSLPIGEVRGSPYLSTYMPAFLDAPVAASSEGLYWIAATMLFWLFWINLMVGLTNILPMLPLDGGHIFRDVAGGAVEKLRPGLSDERRERVVKRLAAGVSLFVLAAFLLQIAGPYLARAFA